MLSAAKGNPSAFEKLYQIYLPSVCLYLRGLGCPESSVSDMAQEVFTRLWCRRQQLAGKSAFKACALGYANKVFLEEQRRLRRARGLAYRLAQDLPHSVVDPAGSEPEIAHTELKQSLDRTITRLTVRHQEAVRLYYAEQMSLEKAARAAGCTPKCFASRLLRARRVLRVLLEAQQTL